MASDAHEETSEEHVGTSRGFSWWVSYVQKVTLECGHTKIYRGHNYPRTRARCPECLFDALNP